VLFRLPEANGNFWARVEVDIPRQPGWKVLELSCYVSSSRKTLKIRRYLDEIRQDTVGRPRTELDFYAQSWLQ
jgi:hypothetical protein